MEIAAPRLEPISQQSSPPPPTAVLPDGEVERLAARVREVSALVMGLTLLAVQEAIAGHPVQGGEALTARFVTRGLLPPSIRPSPQPAILESDHAVLYVRFRAAPLALEIVSLGRTTDDGAPIIGRIMTGSDENVALFIARQTNGGDIPEPFTSAANMIALHWSAEPWRERTFAVQDLDEINHALRTGQVNP